MHFKDGFAKTAFIAPLVGAGARILGRGLMGAAKTVGKGATRVAAGNLTRPLSAGDYLAGGMTALGGMGTYDQHASKMRAAALR